MKAAVLTSQNQPLRILHFKRVSPVGHQVLVRIHKSGLCGAQLNEIQGIKGPDPYLPHLLGHEGSGVVESTGELVKKVRPGDRVVLHWRKGGGGEGPFPRYETEDGASVGGGHVTTFASRALISENRVTPIDADIPFEIACLFGCGVSTGYGIVKNELELKAGASLAVVGCGGVGLNVLQAAALAGAAQVVGVDRQCGTKEALAKRAGATDFIQLKSPESLNSALRAVRQEGFDAVVDTTGDTCIMAEGFKALSKQGTLMLVGQPRLESQLTIAPALELFTGKRILVSEGGGFEPDRDVPILQQLYRKHPSEMQHIITHSFRLDEINDAFTMLKSGLCGRILIDLESSG